VNDETLPGDVLRETIEMVSTEETSPPKIAVGKSRESRFLKVRNIVIVAVLIIILGALYFLSRYNYLLFHSIVEIFSVAISFAIFAIAWNSRRMSDNRYLLFIGISFLFIGGLDTLHTLAYKGMGVFPNVQTNLATQLWIASRYLESFSLLAALFFIERKFRTSIVLVGYSAITGLVLASIYLDAFPAAFINGVGLTPFKVGSEYLISLILLGSILLLWRKQNEFSGKVSKLMITAMAVTIASEMSFTLYTDAYGIANMVGHLLKVVAFYLIYKALIETGLSKPYDLLFHNLKQSETNLKTQASKLEEVNNQLIQQASERKKAEQGLRETRDYLDNLLNYANAPIIVWDPDFKITMFNHAFEQLTGLNANDAVGKSLEILFPEEKKEEALSYIQRTVAGEYLETAEIPIQHLNRTVSTLLWNSANIYNESGTKIIATIAQGHDITLRKEMENQLEKYSRNLEALVEERTKQLKDSERLAAIGATAGMVGHDIRNPLQAITSDLYLAKTDLALVPESAEKKNIQESIGEIEKNIFYVNKIVADLQDFARPLSPKLEKIDLEQTVNSALSRLVIPGNVTVKHSIKRDFPKLNTDPDYMQRILTNLANNAIQAMPIGGKLTISATTKNGRAIINVEDNGEGIPESVRGKLFTPLVTTKSKGQGFGLSVVKRFTEALGGSVSFETEVGKGTKFIIDLPT
jgi:PAS domain S-box-containing protein